MSIGDFAIIFPATTRERGWDKLANGVLLKTAADAGFEVFISIDKNMEHEQNLQKSPLHKTSTAPVRSHLARCTYRTFATTAWP